MRDFFCLICCSKAVTSLRHRKSTDNRSWTRAPFFSYLFIMATYFKEQLAHFTPVIYHGLIPSRESKTVGSGLTHCLRAWFLLLKYRMSFFLIAWFLKRMKKEQDAWWKQMGRETEIKNNIGFYHFYHTVNPSMIFFRSLCTSPLHIFLS